jgi:hypothetical protein
MEALLARGFMVEFDIDGTSLKWEVVSYAVRGSTLRQSKLVYGARVCQPLTSIFLFKLAIGGEQ